MVYDQNLPIKITIIKHLHATISSKETYEKDEYLFEEEDIYKNEVNLIYFKYFIIFILFVILFFFDFKK